jgi:hypothetical protein
MRHSPFTYPHQVRKGKSGVAGKSGAKIQGNFLGKFPLAIGKKWGGEGDRYG